MTQPTIAIDIDGVVGNQVDGLLPRIQRDYGIEMDFWDITEYNPKIGPVDFWHVITEAQKDPNYISEMPLFEGAVDAIACLQQHFRVGFVTARPEHLAELTEEWLGENGISYDFFYCGADGKKHLLDDTFDCLIEDYPKNVQTFLDHHQDGNVILMQQPWNRSHGIQSPRLREVANWMEAVFLIAQWRGFSAGRAQALNTAIAALS